MSKLEVLSEPNIPLVSIAPKGQKISLSWDSLILKGDYKNDLKTRRFFKDIIGVTNNLKSKSEKIILRFHSKEKFRRIDSKPPHESWEIINEEKSFIDILMTVKVNAELRNFIYENSPGIEVKKPNSLRNRIKKDLETALNYYTNI